MGETMAGPFTHWMVAEEATKSLEPGQLRTLMENNLNYLLLGAVSPDLPYLSLGSSDWANRFHWTNTNGIPNAFLRTLALEGIETYDNNVIFSWCMGYVSHMVADAVIHPIVEAIVGKLPENKSEHLECEMTQDSLLFYNLKKQEINGAEYTELIESCRSSEGFFLLMETWQKFIQAVYSNVDSLHTRDWFSNYVNQMDVADGGRLTALSRHNLGLDDYIYKTHSEIINEHPEKYIKYYDKIKMPNEQPGNFMADGFTAAVKNVNIIWQGIYSGLTSKQETTNYVKNWNLDTGEDQGSPKKNRTFWDTMHA